MKQVEGGREAQNRHACTVGVMTEATPIGQIATAPCPVCAQSSSRDCSPGRVSLTVPWKDSSDTWALPLPRVKLNRRPFLVSRRVTGNADSNSPLKVLTEMVALVSGVMAIVTSPLWLESA